MLSSLSSKVFNSPRELSSALPAVPLENKTFVFNDLLKELPADPREKDFLQLYKNKFLDLIEKGVPLTFDMTDAKCGGDKKVVGYLISISRFIKSKGGDGKIVLTNTPAALAACIDQCRINSLFILQGPEVKK